MIGCAAALGIAEIVVRAAGWEPRAAERVDEGPTAFQTHPDLGWEPVPGRHRWPDGIEDDAQVVLTVNEDGHRSSSYARVDAEYEIVLTGGSFTLGWAVSDWETFAWHLQNKLPDRKIVNLGVSGYGTYQSLLRLKRELPDADEPRMVLYGFIDHHETRNVAKVDWLRWLAESGDGAQTPRAGLHEDGSIEHHGLYGYIMLPLRQHSALVAFIEDAWMTHVVGDLEVPKRDVTERLVLDMREEAERHGATFAVAFLHAKEKKVKRLTKFLEANGIPSMDCSFPLTDEMQVGGKGHPNSEMHRRWAGCIHDGLPDALEPRKPDPVLAD
jgi:hypothetical protein